MIGIGSLEILFTPGSTSRSTLEGKSFLKVLSLVANDASATLSRIADDGDSKSHDRPDLIAAAGYKRLSTCAFEKGDRRLY